MKILNILYLEDSADDAALTGRVLRKAGITFEFNIVDTRDEYLLALNARTVPDLVLADHSLFQFNSSDALALFKERGFNIPFILVTGTVSEEFAVNILKEGADDYLLKSNLTRLPSAVVNSLEKYRYAHEKQRYLDNIIANEALMKSAEQLAHFGSWHFNDRESKMQWSDGIFGILGYFINEVIPSYTILLNHIHADDKKKFEEKVMRQSFAAPDFAGEFKVIDKHGLLKYVVFQVASHYDSSRTLVNQLGFMQDMTEKRLLENELAKQALLRQKLITEVTIQAQERERKFLGQELHDNINQILTGAKINLKIASNSSTDARKKKFLEIGVDQIGHAVEEIRHLSKSLVAPALTHFGLHEALKELANSISVTDTLRIYVQKENIDNKVIEDAMALMFYRIAQEQLNNIRKYAKATEVYIQLNADDNYYYFSVADNGVGFDASEHFEGIGLLNMNNRVEFYEGNLEIVSAPGQGCCINIRIPRPKADEE